LFCPCPISNTTNYNIFSGKYEIISEGFKHKTIDFVDDPSVSETEEDICLESKNLNKEQKEMTIEELKAQNPELFAKLDEEKVAIQKTLDEANTKITSSYTKKRVYTYNGR
jgi:MarR-like DNA-binding transcriptional regulator SgrR of sgrS sRNA